MGTTRFFCQAADQFTGPMAYLGSRQFIFYNDQTSGMIEVQLGLAEWIIQLFLRGVNTGTYHFTDDFCKPILMSELHSIWNGSNAPIFTQILPDVAGRLAWLALESQTQTKSRARNATEWEAWITSRKEEKLTGLVQIASEFFDGFVYLRKGKWLIREHFFHGPGFPDRFAFLPVRTGYTL